MKVAKSFKKLPFTEHMGMRVRYAYSSTVVDFLTKRDLFFN